jgi:uncharacterized protein (DUF697 family)
MNDEQVRALLTIAWMAARADGRDDPRESGRLAALAASHPGSAVDPAALEQSLLRAPPALDDVAATLASDGRLAQLAYEAAVSVVDADGSHTEAEGAFLARLASVLRLPAARSGEYLGAADAIASAAVPSAATESDRPVAPRSPADVAAIDARILDASITNAALELLPETLASLAILPLQVRLVYRIGQAYGHALDQGHIKEFIATLGVGLTGQYVEQFGRRLLGGLLGSVLGGVGRVVGRQAASSGMAFATTYAIGRIAREYYAAGRTLDRGTLQRAFGDFVAQGRDLVATYAPAIEERARTIDVRNLPQLIGRL